MTQHVCGRTLNTYSYSVDNPIAKKDPSGKYWDLSANINYSPVPGLPGLSAALGLRIDSNGAIGYVAPGFGWGYGGKLINVSHTPGDIPRDQTTDAVTGTDVGPLGWSSNISPSGAYSPTSFSLALGAGVDTYVRKEYLSTLYGSPIVQDSRSTLPLFYPGQSLAAYRSPGSQSQQQSRINAASNYNGTTGATSNQSRLWVTPSGAIVNWGGLVIVPSIASTKK